MALLYIALAPTSSRHSFRRSLTTGVPPPSELTPPPVGIPPPVIYGGSSFISNQYFDVGTEDGVLLKWRAEFGSTLQSCVILGGTRIDQKPNLASSPAEPAVAAEDNVSIPDSFYTNGSLKLRVVWTISSLIAASTRHYLLRPIVEHHPTIRSLVIADANGQGTLSMGAEQLREFRENPVAISATSNRTQVPSSNMKLRYAPFLELLEGVRIQGVTLVAIRPSKDSVNTSNNGGNKKEPETFISGAFDEPLKEAVKALVKRRTYLLEMNGF